MQLKFTTEILNLYRKLKKENDGTKTKTYLEEGKKSAKDDAVSQEAEKKRLTRGWLRVYIAKMKEYAVVKLMIPEGHKCTLRLLELGTGNAVG